MRLLVMAGGTGGHVFPALAVAKRLREEGVDVLWMGTRRGFEARAVPAAGFEMAWIDVAGVRGKGWQDRLLAPARILRALWQALRVIRAYRPRLVLGLGGYAAGPGGLAAWLLGVPLIIHEQNAAPGTTNRLLSRLARQVLQAYPNALGSGGKVATVGNPVREELAALPLPDERGVGTHRPLRILVLGGSLGALALNQILPPVLGAWAGRVQVRHQGGRTLEAARQAYAQTGLGGDLELVEFIDDMAAALSWADLLICRAGALTLAEVAAVGVASVLVPFPYAIDDHQTRNAEHLVRAGAAVLMPESEMRAGALPDVLKPLLEQPDVLLQMAQAARQCAHPQATGVIADFCRPYLGLPTETNA